MQGGYNFEDLETQSFKDYKGGGGQNQESTAIYGEDYTMNQVSIPSLNSQ
jgi:hypothetical protein